MYIYLPLPLVANQRARSFLNSFVVHLRYLTPMNEN